VEREEVPQEGEDKADIVRALLPGLSDDRLTALADLIGLEVPGFRRGKVPRSLLIGHLGRAKECDPELVLDAFLDEHAEVGKLIQNSTLEQLRSGVPDLVSRFGLVPVRLWLGIDKRKGARRLAERLRAEQAAPGEPSARSEGRAASGKSGAGPGGRTPGRPTERAAASPGRGRARDQAELRRLREQVRRLEREKKQAQREAGEAGRTVGELRKRVQELEERLAAAESRCGAGGPLVIETGASLAGDERLEAAHRQIDRLELEVESLWRENRALSGALRREEQKAGELRDRLEGTVLCGPAGSFRACLPFRYTGPDGRFDFSGSFKLLVPASYVDRFDLADGDLVDVTVTPPRKVELEVVDRRPRREVLGHASRYSSETWKVIDTRGRAVGWIGEREAAAHKLSDGDPVTVLRPEYVQAQETGRPLLPRVRVLRVHREAREEAGGVERAGGTAGGGALRRRRARRRKLSRAAARHGRLRELGHPLAGKKVLVVGGDSFQPGYRRIVESLGGAFDALEAGDTGRAESKALAADVVVIMTSYVSHKVGDLVEDTLERAGRRDRLALANSTGHHGFFEALRPFFQNRGEEPA